PALIEEAMAPTRNNEVHILSKHALLVNRAAMASVVTGCFLTIIKVFAFLLTGSVALLTSLVDSIIDVIASLINMFAIRHSLVPADKEHRFGHGKIESLAGLAQSAFIFGSAIFIIVEAINRLIYPTAITHGVYGIGVMVISIIATLLLVIFQRYVIRKTGSVAISADSLHYASDFLFNFSVILALVLSYYFDMQQADPAIAIIIALCIIYSAWKIAASSMDQLMDRELPDEDRERIRQIALSHDYVLDVHGLRSRSSGPDIFIQLHLEMDRNLVLEKAHRVADDVEKSICAAYPNADVIIHEDPDNEPADGN
ncbi:MAG TPA: cation diffusion facilitator family transporter, partial [Gammaproteobacteria bacterium]|nr:cation diffusion facilitator family transporter [Gammaproteobacteria bacterium]